MGILKGKVVILNAPAGAGKDSIASSISEVTGAAHREFKGHLYKCTANLFNVDLSWFKEVSTCRDLKEEINNHLKIPYEGYFKLMELLGKQDELGYVEKREGVPLHITPREALIYTSEIVIKPNLGEDYFGQSAAKIVDLEKGAVFSDGGFDKEIESMIKSFGKDNVFIVKFTRAGKVAFEGDSRGWLNIPEGVSCLNTTNDGRVAELRDEILNWVVDKSINLCKH